MEDVEEDDDAHHHQRHKANRLQVESFDEALEVKAEGAERLVHLGHEVGADGEAGDSGGRHPGGTEQGLDERYLCSSRL